MPFGYKWMPWSMCEKRVPARRIHVHVHTACRGWFYFSVREWSLRLVARVTYVLRFRVWREKREHHPNANLVRVVTSEIEGNEVNFQVVQAFVPRNELATMSFSLKPQIKDPTDLERKYSNALRAKHQLPRTLGVALPSWRRL